MRSIYILESIMPNEDSKVPNQYAIEEDGSIKCHREMVGVYDDVTLAEKDMHKLIAIQDEFNEEYDCTITYFAFVLTEHYLNDAMDEHGNTSSFESIRTYLGNGELNCFSDYDDRCKKKFIGLKEHQKFVKDGDYCLMLCGDRIVPILLAKCTPTVEDLKARFKHGYVGDFTDDSGLGFIVDYGHTHPFTSHVFPTSNLKGYVFHEEQIKKLDKEYQDYLNGKL